MAEDPFVRLLEGRSPRLVDNCLDVARVRHRQVFEAAIPDLSVVVLCERISDSRLTRRKRGIQTYPKVHILSEVAWMIPCQDCLLRSFNCQFVLTNF